MAREHKFRVYDTEADAICEVITLNRSTGSDWHEATVYLDGKYYVRPMSKLKLMQYTDIRDLWEDDVIEFRTFDGKGYIGVVKWGEFCYEVETTDDFAPVLYLLDDVIDFNSIVKKGDKWTTPELLND